MIVSNQEELQQVIDNLVSQALDLTTEELLNKLEEFIQSDVYGVQSIWDTVYGLRTGEFGRSWDRTKAKKVTRNIIETEIFQNVSAMSIVDIPPIHIDRDDLAEIINSGTGYNFGKMKDIPRPFWDDFMKWIDGHFDGIFRKNCISVGLSV